MIAKHPPKLAEGLPTASGTNPVSRPNPNCAHCPKPLGRAALFVNDPSGVSGWFHIDCYTQARMGHAPVEARLLHADLESVIGWEDCQRELVAP